MSSPDKPPGLFNCKTFSNDKFDERRFICLWHSRQCSQSEAGCMLPIGLQSMRGEPIGLDMLDTVEKACCYWKLIHFRSSRESHDYRWLNWFFYSITKISYIKIASKRPKSLHITITYWVSVCILLLVTHARASRVQVDNWQVHTGRNLHPAYFKVQRTSSYSHWWPLWRASAQCKGYVWCIGPTPGDSGHTCSERERAHVLG